MHVNRSIKNAQVGVRSSRQPDLVYELHLNKVELDYRAADYREHLLPAPSESFPAESLMTPEVALRLKLRPPPLLHRRLARLQTRHVVRQADVGL